MTEKATSSELLQALRYKFPKAAILREVTMEDEEEAARVRSAQVLNYPSMKKFFDKKGLSYDSEVPDDYDYRKAVWFRRIDALMFEGPKRTAIEIKVSRADFFKDTPAKRYAWFKHSHRFIYLVPKGLVKMDEVPEGCGLWEYEDGDIVTAKKAKVNHNAEDLPASMMKYFAWRAFIAEQKVSSDMPAPRARRKKTTARRRK